MTMNKKVKAEWLGQTNSAIKIGFFIHHYKTEPSIGKYLIVCFHRQGDTDCFIRETGDWYVEHIAKELGIEYDQVLEICTILIRELKHNLSVNNTKDIEYDFDYCISQLRGM